MQHLDKLNINQSLLKQIKQAPSSAASSFSSLPSFRRGCDRFWQPLGHAEVQQKQLKSCLCLCWCCCVTPEGVGWPSFPKEWVGWNYKAEGTSNPPTERQTGTCRKDKLLMKEFSGRMDRNFGLGFVRSYFSLVYNQKCTKDLGIYFDALK